MSQHDLDIANQGFPATRADINNALQALGSSNSGATAPSTTYANQLWYDTANNIIKIRNEDNDAWISLFTLDQTNDNIEALTVNGTVTADALTVDTNTLHVDATNNRVGVGTTAPGHAVHIVQPTANDTSLMLEQSSVYSWQIGMPASGAALRFMGGGAEKARLLSSGGLTFNGDTAAANALDDYEEGTYTPVISATDGIGTLTYSAQVGRYTKVGNRVSFNLYIAINAKGTVAGHLRFTLPFTNKNVANNNVSFSGWINGSVSGQPFDGDTMMFFFASANESIAKVYSLSGTGGVNQLHADHVANGTDFMVSGTYEV